MLKFGVIVMFGLSFLTMNSYALTAAELYKQVGGSVYPVYGYDSKSKKRMSGGTAVAVSTKILATNCHISNGADRYEVKINGKHTKAQLLYQDFNHDLCFLEVSNFIFTPVKFRDSQSVEIGEEVYAIGNPHGLEKSISRGIISNKHAFMGGALLQTDATISFGSSGGGLFDTKGRLIGLTRAGHRYKDIAFAVPADWIVDVLNAARDGRRSADINRILTENIEREYARVVVSAEPIGRYGQDKIGLYRYKNKCFIGMLGKKSKEQQGLLIWYPHQPNVVYFSPYEKNVNKAFGHMVRHGHVQQVTGEVMTGVKGDNSILPTILQTTQIVAKRFNENPKKQFTEGNRIYLHYPDVYNHYKEVTIAFGLMGFKRAFYEYDQLCR